MVKIILLTVAFYFFIRFIFKVVRALSSPPPQRPGSYYGTVDWEEKFQRGSHRNEKDISDRAKIIED